MIRWYIMPAYQHEHNGMNYTWPKYLKANVPPFAEPPAGGLDVRYSWRPYGLIPAALVVAEVTQVEHDSLVANPDCVSSPENIDQNIAAGAIPTVQNVLEALRIPAGWVTTAYTYRDILRMVAGLIQFAQRHRALHSEELIPSQAALDLQWNQIGGDRQTRIQTTVADLNYNTDGITGTTTVRQILWNFAQQWGDSEFKFGQLATL